MRWIVQTSLRFPYLVVFLALSMLVFGIVRMRDASVDVFPEFAPPKVEVQTICVGLSPTAVEELVTVPIEQALNGVPGLQVMRSKSVPDLSSIVLIFRPGTDLILARQQPLLATQKGRSIAERVGDVARAIAFLASDDAASCTGADLAVDGGNTAGRVVRGAPGA